MKTTATPGPWDVHTTNGGAIYVVDNHRFADASIIVRIDGSGENPVANARLIAAAPSLLEALQQFLACVEAEWGADFIPYNLSDENGAQANAAVLAARAAISRATGKEI